MHTTRAVIDMLEPARCARVDIRRRYKCAQSENQAGPDVPQPVDGPDVQPPAEAGLAYEQRGRPSAQKSIVCATPVYVGASQRRGAQGNRSRSTHSAAHLLPRTVVWRSPLRSCYGLTPLHISAAFTVPHFSTKGSAVVEEQSVRLTGPEPKLRGGVWNNEPLFSINWEVNVEFRATGGRCGPLRRTAVSADEACTGGSGTRAPYPQATRQ